jgi:hypothetical protein
MAWDDIVLRKRNISCLSLVGWCDTVVANEITGIPVMFEQFTGKRTLPSDRRFL